jgi:hypothetical protein
MFLVLVPGLAMSERWDRPLPGYRQLGCYGREDVANNHATALKACGIEARVIYKPAVECHAVLKLGAT